MGREGPTTTCRSVMHNLLGHSLVSVRAKIEGSTKSFAGDLIDPQEQLFIHLLTRSVLKYEYVPRVCLEGSDNVLERARNSL